MYLYYNQFFSDKKLFSGNGMQDMLRQMSQNPGLMQSMMSAPHMQNMMQTMSNNPEMVQQVYSYIVFYLHSVESIFVLLSLYNILICLLIQHAYCICHINIEKFVLKIALQMDYFHVLFILVPLYHTVTTLLEYLATYLLTSHCAGKSFEKIFLFK